MRAWSLLLGLLTSCAVPTWQRAPHDVPFQRTEAPQTHVKPAKNRASDGWTAVSYNAAAPLAYGLNPGHWLADALDLSPAGDTNAFGQVLDSTWFENRVGRHDLSPEAFARGPNQSAGPADGRLLVLGGKLAGATPGLIVQDSRQDRYLIKFDPAAFPELASGAEVISTKVLWAAGYHVPENYVLRFDLNRLTLSPTARTGGKYGKSIPLTKDRLRDLIAHVNPFSDGTIRAMFSKIIDGEALGPFAYRGLRADDPNDRLVHEQRRSLRGLWLLSAWLNNVDTRDANTLDMFVPSAMKNGHVKHYLLDFGDALGSAGTRPKFIGEGYEGRLDWPQVAKSLFTAGLWYRYWLPIQRSPFRAVGVFEAEVFEPGRWRPNLPNPAFEARGMLDIYWAAALIARYDVDDLIAIVDQAKFSDPGAASWILRVLLQRQQKILEWVFDRVLPLDRPQVTQGYTAEFEDLGVRSALLSTEQVGYSWQLMWHRDSGPQRIAGGENFEPVANLGPAIAALKAREPTALQQAPFFTLLMRRPLPTPDLAPVQLHLRLLPEGLIMVGLDRESP